uniref:Secreted protein n=1 Tax=Physcomitrium patens TaxID=3218 RepID=A0A2K1J8P0_PHYPA|nr:hypothetical protein PHYPA_021020 [Physcomitrium patens]
MKTRSFRASRSSLLLLVFLRGDGQFSVTRDVASALVQDLAARSGRNGRERGTRLEVGCEYVVPQIRVTACLIETNR